MRTALFALSFVAVSAFAAQAGDNTLIWKGPQASSQVLEMENGTTVGNCYPTLRQREDAKGNIHTFYYPQECETPNIKNHVNMGWSVDELPVRTKGLKEGRQLKFNKNGKIILFD